MELTRDEEAILRGEKGPRQQECMRILATLGEMYGARKLLPVYSVQLSGISYKTMGSAGTEFLEEMAEGGAKFAVRTTINPAGYDVGGPGLVRTHEDFRAKQDRLVKALMTLGATPTFTCTPYTTEFAPPPGAHLAWAESSAVIYANSVIGAFSNREGAPSALASAVLGKTPDYGLHRPEGRRAQVVVDVDLSKGPMRYTVVGAYLGKILGQRIPYFRGFRPLPDVDAMKELGSSLSAWGAVPMMHVEGVTPEAGKQDLEGLEHLSVDAQIVGEFQKCLGCDESPNLVAIGCPHCTKGELIQIAQAVKQKGRRLKPGTELWVCSNRKVIQENAAAIQVLRQAGAKVIQDTCMVVAPLSEQFPVAAVNSAKASFYMNKKAFSGQKIVFDTTENLVEKYL
ncbi:MAG: aconitase X catalytic domain-containing protein [Euryarchaeota archaeon]|nr:aconitase X catalytic domain-containing protein [Euryarchaeota archaeon]MDE1836000.1 aconitase X catalytic domain-containing protein [Euryarchaeota archaeon]MDE1880958.1 aconitase X catalytic domain-containing protein [Euryarchaeota archaeon]MDE2046008.1 aconitase X catalytic domain-containing protein [Thermoplasmata archaeon]